jgi:uroporphyrinogen decarboxylase
MGGAGLEDIPGDIDESELELVDHVLKELGDTHFIVGRIGAGIFPADKYRFDFLLMSMVDQPELVRRIIEIETAYTIAVAEALLEAGCDAIMDLSDVAGNRGPYMSPTMFREFILPALKAQSDVAHAKGKYYLKHTDGNTWAILDMMIEAGVDGWHGIQPSIGMTLPALQERYGGRLCFFGGVDVSTLVAGTEEEVAEEVRVAVESAPAEGGLVLTSGNTLMVGTRYENYMAMLGAAKSYWE